jgi:hypothetical protein
MFRKGVYEKIGGYRKIFKYGQDRDLFIRMLEKNGKGFIVDELLYQRRSVNDDGVSSSKDKLLIQQALSNFAVQCYYDRLEFGKDFIDLYDHHALIFRKKNIKFANFSSKLSLISILKNDFSAADKFSYIALNEKVTPITLITLAISTSSKHFKFIPAILKFLAKKHSRYSSWISKN